MLCSLAGQEFILDAFGATKSRFGESWIFIGKNARGILPSFVFQDKRKNRQLTGLAVGPFRNSISEVPNWQ